MPEFSYKAKDSKGGLKTGKLKAKSKAEAKKSPRSLIAMPQGLLVPSQNRSNWRVRGWFRKIAQVNSYV